MAYRVQETPDGNKVWTEVGIVWAHRDNRGFNVITAGNETLILRAITKRKK